MTISPDDAADAALAYALWDSEHTVRMRADAIEEYLARARSARHWLKVHGHEVVAIDDTASMLRAAIDEAWGIALEDGSVPSTKIQDKIIAAARAAVSPTPPASPPASSDAPDR